MDDLYKTGIRPYIDDYLLEEAKKVRDYGAFWSASSAGYCMRKVIFDRLQVPHINPDARKQRIFTSGHIFHEWVQGITMASGKSVAQEVELIDDRLMIKGHFDDLVLIDGNLILIDYKTQNSQAFTWQQKQKKGMSYFHKMQLGTYMHMIRTGATLRADDFNYGDIQLIRNLSEARILKISKDDLRMTEEQLMWTPALEKAVATYWKRLNGFWDGYRLPPCTCKAREGGFMAKALYNPYFYGDKPCSKDWLKLCIKEGKITKKESLEWLEHIN